MSIKAPSWSAALVLGFAASRFLKTSSVRRYSTAYGAIAFVLAQTGKKKLHEAAPLIPEQTAQTVKEDIEWAKTRVKSGARQGGRARQGRHGQRHDRRRRRRREGRARRSVGSDVIEHGKQLLHETVQSAVHTAQQSAQYGVMLDDAGSP